MAEEMDLLGEHISVFGGIHINAYLQASKAPFIKGIYLEKYPKRTLRAFKSLNRWGATLSGILYKPDVVHETYFSTLPSFRTNAPVFITVYDMIQELFPTQFRRDWLVTEEKMKRVGAC